MHVYPHCFARLLSLTWVASTNQNKFVTHTIHRSLHQKLMPIPLVVYVDGNSHGRFEIHNKVHNKFTKKWNRSRHTICRDYTANTSHSANQCFNELVYQSGSPKSLTNHSVSKSACQPPDSRGRQFTSHSVSQWISQWVRLSAPSQYRWQVLGSQQVCPK